ncbi:MAG: DinB family protein [Spirochaetia bacterium]
MSNAYTAMNAAWREKLSALVDHLSDADMARAAGGRGWTVGGLLGHLAFWDQRALLLLDKWKKEGIAASPMDIDVVNESMQPFLNAISPREVRWLVKEASIAVDAAIDALDPAFLARIEAEGKPVRLNRGTHREHHMAQIEKL